MSDDSHAADPPNRDDDRETMTPERRRPQYRRNESLEGLLEDLNSNLWPVEKQLVAEYGQPRWPIILLVGAPRSGTTLFLQWLGATGIAAYPTNLLSRFFRAPILGAKIQLLLTDERFRFRDELEGLAVPVEFASDNGKTRGALSPNEFWYFWRRFLPDPLAEHTTDEAMHCGFDRRTFLAELAGLVDVFDKPFATKALLFNYNLAYLNSLFERAVFVHIRRDPATNAASLLRARERQWGSRGTWYSTRIPEYEELLHLSPVEQVAAQVACNDRAVRRGLEGVSDERILRVGYEAFCADPWQVWSALQERLSAQGYDVATAYDGPEGFEVSRRSLLSGDDRERALATYCDYYDKTTA